MLGAVVALDPGGFWSHAKPHGFFLWNWLSIRTARLLQPLLPALAESRLGRSLLLARLSARPAQVAPQVALDEMRSCAGSPIFDRLLRRLAYEEKALGAPAGSIEAPLVLGWGRNDRVCPPSEARRALELFPDARLHWFERCGHFPQWDAPDDMVRLVLATTDRRPLPTADSSAAAADAAEQPALRAPHRQARRNA